MSIEIDWDDRKAELNLAKHGVNFAEAASVFFDPLALTYPDGKHSLGEPRFLTFGLSENQCPPGNA